MPSSGHRNNGKLPLYQPTHVEMISPRVAFLLLLGIIPWQLAKHTAARLAPVTNTRKFADSGNYLCDELTDIRDQRTASRAISQRLITLSGRTHIEEASLNDLAVCSTSRLPRAISSPFSPRFPLFERHIGSDKLSKSRRNSPS